jgi:hypothetical protein
MVFKKELFKKHCYMGALRHIGIYLYLAKVSKNFCIYCFFEIYLDLIVDNLIGL